MPSHASPLHEPHAAAATRGDRRLWLGYAGLCLLCWLLYAIAGRDADRGSWQVWETVYEATWNLAPPMLLGTLALPWVRWLQRKERPAPARLGLHALGALAFASLWHLLEFTLAHWFFKAHVRPCDITIQRHADDKDYFSHVISSNCQ